MPKGVLPVGSCLLLNALRFLILPRCQIFPLRTVAFLATVERSGAWRLRRQTQRSGTVARESASVFRRRFMIYRRPPAVALR